MYKSRQMRRMNLFTTLVTLCIVTGSAWGQKNCITLQGKTFEASLTDSTEVALMDIPIEIWADDSILAVIYSQDKGRYKFSLPFFHRYRVRYGGGNLISKWVEIDANNFVMPTRYKGYTLDIDIVLFKAGLVKGLEFLDTDPIARAYFSPTEKTVVWDIDLTERMNRKLEDKINNAH